ncbi:pyrin domain-containing protein 1-like [Pseudorasbora parva]|uniref:pyrin domain-containing protein 1-like n=1 Tax=Pseudorasbora parva TaxID=51549 RepID=UPI00351F48AE
MATTQTVILNALKDLRDKEFKEFKWHLLNGGLTDSCIPRGSLDDADRHEVVDLMVQKYKESEAGRLAVKALHKINLNDLAEKLKGSLPEVPEDVPAAGGESSSAGKAGPAETGHVSMNIQASNGGTVKAPVVHGAVFQGEVNFG